MSKPFPGVCHGLVEGAGLSCSVEVQGKGLQVSAPPHTPFLLPYSSLSLGFSGVDDRYLRLSGPVAGKDVHVLVPDKTIVEEMAGTGAPGTVLAAVRRIENARARRRGARLAVFGALLAMGVIVVLAGLAVLRSAERRAVDLVPTAWESTLGKVAAQGILADTKTCTNPALRRAANEIGLRLVGALGATPYNYKIRVLDSDEVNAFALPGGYVFLNRGLIEIAADPDEIAGVLAHELQHVQLRHGIANIVRQAGIMLGLAVLLGDMGTLEGMLLRNAAQLVDMSYSREQESAADAAGVRLMHVAGLDPSGLPRFLLTLAEKEGVSGAIPSFLSTHPDSKGRSEELAELVKQLGPGQRRPLSLDLPALRGACDPIAVADPDAP